MTLIAEPKSRAKVHRSLSAIRVRDERSVRYVLALDLATLLSCLGTNCEVTDLSVDDYVKVREGAIQLLQDPECELAPMQVQVRQSDVLFDSYGSDSDELELGVIDVAWNSGSIFAPTPRLQTLAIKLALTEGILLLDDLQQDGRGRSSAQLGAMQAMKRLGDSRVTCELVVVADDEDLLRSDGTEDEPDEIVSLTEELANYHPLLTAEPILRHGVGIDDRSLFASRYELALVVQQLVAGLGELSDHDRQQLRSNRAGYLEYAGDFFTKMADLTVLRQLRDGEISIDALRQTSLLSSVNMWQALAGAYRRNVAFGRPGGDSDLEDFASLLKVLEPNFEAVPFPAEHPLWERARAFKSNSIAVMPFRHAHIRLVDLISECFCGAVSVGAVNPSQS